MNDQYTTRRENISDSTIYQQPQMHYEMEVVRPKLDLNYLNTLSGMLKCICITLNFLCFICLIVGAPAYYSGTGWINFVCITGILISLTLLILYLFHIVDFFTQIPWIVAEMIYCFAWTVFFFLCTSVLALVALRYRGFTGYGAASFFSMGAMFAYGFDCYLKFLAWKNDEVTSGGIPLNYSSNNNRTIWKNQDHQREIIIRDGRVYV